MSEANFVPLRIRTLKPDREIPFELHIFFKDTYLRYSAPGASLDEGKFKKLKKQKIAKFYILESDESKYQEFLDQILMETLEDENATVEEKVNIAEGAAEHALEKVNENPESEKNFKAAENAAQGLRKLVLENPEALGKIFGRKVEEHEKIIKHSLNVCVLSCKLGEKLKCRPMELDQLATAALMHDIGLTKLEPEQATIFDIKKSDYTPEQKLIHKLHIDDGLRALKEKDFITKEIMELIETHEEILSGDGPLKVSKLSKLQEILSLVNRYDKKLITQDISPKEALQELMVDELGNYELKKLEKFKEVLTEEGILK